MPSGRVVRWFPDRRFGFIAPDAGGSDIWFHVGALQGLAPTEITARLAVTYELEVGPKGPRARAVTPVVTTGTPSSGRSIGTGYRFRNPYNFARLFRARRPVDNVLGSCEPPPHDRYIGLTGRLVCELRASTPLFVSDSHAVVEVEGEPRDHRKFRFFRYDAEPAIPATTIRGSIRAVFEAATNSCLAVFDGDTRLSFRLPPEEALGLLPGRAVRREEKWTLEVMRGATVVPAQSQQSGKKEPMRDPLPAAWVKVYGATRDFPAASSYASRQRVDLGGLKHGDKCWAVIELTEHPSRRFQFWNVVALAPTREELGGAESPTDDKRRRAVHGYLCITNQNIKNKHDERLFFRVEESDTTAHDLELPETVRVRYNELMQEYYKRHRDEVAHRRCPAAPDGDQPGFSRFMIEQESLADGALVYAKLGTTDRGESFVEYIAPVSIPRLCYEHVVGDLVRTIAEGDSFETPDPAQCEQFQRLCPACRMFGWVSRQKRDVATTTHIVAYAGRLRFTHATCIKREAFSSDPMTLAILSSPKPTTTRFYLSDAEGRPLEKLGDRRSGYDGQDDRGRLNRLRGRKFYLHHGSQFSPKECWRAGKTADRQNRTVTGILGPGTLFRFTIDFENLSEQELGALLWAIELEGGMHHRLGFAKPLGFGSVAIRVTALEYVKMGDRYSSLCRSGRVDILDKKPRLVTSFKEGMRRIYGQPFEELPSVRDLTFILSEQVPPLPIHYPRPNANQDTSGNNYEWFVWNKRSGKRPGPRLALPEPDDADGLPLIDRSGELLGGKGDRGGH